MSRHSFPPASDAETLPNDNSTPDSEAPSTDNRCYMLVNNNGLAAFTAIPRQFRDQESSAPDAVTIDMSLAAEGERIAAEMGRSRWMQCDACARFTDRLHYCVAYGLDTAACDQCAGYEAEAYDEPPARYLDEQPDPQEQAEWDRIVAARDMPGREP